MIVFSVILLYFMFLHFIFILWAVVSAAYSALLSSSYFERINDDEKNDDDISVQHSDSKIAVRYSRNADDDDDDVVVMEVVLSCSFVYRFWQNSRQDVICLLVVYVAATTQFIL